MTHAILETNGGVTRVIALPAEAPADLPPGLAVVDVSGVMPAPGLNWITRDGGQSFTDPAAPVLADIRAGQIMLMRAACAAAITGSYHSSALGAQHTYPGGATDQANLQAARGATMIPLLMCADANGVWTLLPHTGAQTEQVNADWITHRQTQQERLMVVSAQIAAAATVDAVRAITWSTAG